jgi:hypothetical protein
MDADEGRGLPPIWAGEPESGCDPAISEWGNPPAFIGWDAPLNQLGGDEGTGGTETSHVPRGTDIIPVVAASEPGAAQTAAVPSVTALRSPGCKTCRTGVTLSAQLPRWV